MSPRVVHLRSSAGLYGAEYMLLSLLPALAKAGVDASLLSFDNPRLGRDPLRDAARARGIDVATLPCRSRLDVRTVGALRRTLLARRADVIHVHDYKSAAYAWLATRGLPIRRVATIHGWTDASAALKWYRRIEMTVLRRFDAICVVSPQQRDALVDAGLDRTRIVPIANGVDTLRFEPSAAPATELRGGATHVFGTAARLSPEKSLDVLLRAFATVAREHADVHLAIVGDGEERAALESLRAALGLGDRVTFAGRRDDLERCYAAFDTFVLSSRTEGMPMAMLEAMACEVPVVATAVGSIPDLLAGANVAKSSANVVQAGNDLALAAALRLRLAGPTRDPALRRFVVRELSSERMAANYAGVYRNLTGLDHAPAAA